MLRVWSLGVYEYEYDCCHQTTVDYSYYSFRWSLSFENASYIKICLSQRYSIPTQRHVTCIVAISLATTSTVKRRWTWSDDGRRRKKICHKLIYFYLLDAHINYIRTDAIRKHRVSTPRHPCVQSTHIRWSVPTMIHKLVPSNRAHRIWSLCDMLRLVPFSVVTFT